MDTNILKWIAMGISGAATCLIIGFGAGALANNESSRMEMEKTTRSRLKEVYEVAFAEGVMFAEGYEQKEIEA